VERGSLVKSFKKKLFLSCVSFLTRRKNKKKKKKKSKPICQKKVKDKEKNHRNRGWTDVKHLEGKRGKKRPRAISLGRGTKDFKREGGMKTGRYEQHV